jgi:beta-phosphoglucomutase-like phosphatase (HAD superfamily)
MSKYQGVIFDLDGVICFTDHYHYLAWKSLADSLGIDFDEKRMIVCAASAVWKALKSF